MKYMGAHAILKMRKSGGGDTRAVLEAIRRIVRALRVGSRAAEKRTGLSGAQLFVLQQLAPGRELSLSELAERTFTHQSSVSVVVARLVQRKLVKRKRAVSDARRLELALTAAGLAALKKSPDLAQHNLIEALSAMPAAQRRKTALLLEDLVARAGFAGETAALFFEDEKNSLG